TQLSSILQIWLHRALTRQVDPGTALDRAAAQIRDLLERVGLAPGERPTGADPAEPRGAARGER
ncbi:MAG TPA: hypothetical protein VE173_11755, partial [Longimicrobiales bacterium]|nr:hypothetical protein [Longimicrobiales bacterium]